MLNSDIYVFNYGNNNICQHYTIGIQYFKPNIFDIITNKLS
jgi:hypothetical protein